MRDLTKRTTDVIGALTALLVLAPVMAVVAAMVRVKLGSPVLFRQQRPGRDGEPFRLLKFRTMTNDCDVDGNLLPTEERLHPFGRRLRSTSLDELPSLINILRGEMSLVGPRPLRMEYLPRYSPHQARRHEVRPGLTGWAQVNGRNDLDWNDRFELDVWYVDHRSLRLDARIIALTLRTVVRRRGVHDEQGGTIDPFLGDDAASPANP